MASVALLRISSKRNESTFSTSIQSRSNKRHFEKVVYNTAIELLVQNVNVSIQTFGKYSIVNQDLPNGQDMLMFL